MITPKEYIILSVCICLIVAQVFLEIKIPETMGQLTNFIYSGQTDTGQNIHFGLIMLCYALVSLIFSFIVAYGIARTGASLDGRLRKSVFNRILSFSLSEVGEFGTSSLISRSTTDIYQIQTFLVNGFQTIIKSSVMIIWITVKIVRMNKYWRLATVVDITIMLTVLILITNSILPVVKKIQQTNDELIRVNSEHISGIRVVHAFNGYDVQRKRFDDVNDKVTDLEIKNEKTMALFNPVANMLMYSLMVVIYFIGAKMIDGASADMRSIINSQMIEFISLVSMMIASIVFLIIVVVTMPAFLISVKRISEVLDKPLSIEEPDKSDIKSPIESGTIEFKNVSFRYPGSREDSLKNISFTVNKGEMVAIVGGTGSGKTTLLNLIPRLYDVTDGEVSVNGINVKNYQVRELRNILGYVPQKSFLFSGTVYENIDYGDNGKMGRALDGIIRAAKVGQVDEFINKNEDGYYQRVEEGGSNFSGGQKQRLTISRAIARDPEIFLFDDSFSALDYKTDKKLRTELRATAGDSTMLIVAQRISTVRDADRIIVLDKGHLIGMGNHEELMESCQVYREIALSQA